MALHHRTAVVMSGGMDSSTLLWQLLDEGDECLTVTVDYGQRHRKEIEAAQQMAAICDVPHRLVNVAALSQHLTGSALTDDVDVPHGHYAEESMRATVVPNRNMILLAVAGGVAVANGCNRIATAVHAGDHFVYPDCRPQFIESCSATLAIATESFGDVTIHAPFVNITKAEIAARGEVLGVPWAKTWTCYEGGDIHCGRCATCVERLEAFDLAGVTEPTEYADSYSWRKVVASPPESVNG